MKIIGLMFAIVILSVSASTEVHPLKMSFSKLMISSGGNVELETRIFLDDLTLHMQNLYGLQEADFSTTTSNGTEALQNYLHSHLYFEQDGKKLSLMINAVSLSKNRIALVVNMSTSSQLDLTKDVFLVNTLLCDASPMQTNDIRYLNKHLIFNVGNPKVKIQTN